MKKYLLPENVNWYRANMHCHTTCSDGALTPEEVKEAYKNMGYSIVAYTDHEILLDHSDLNDENFLALTSSEYSVNEAVPSFSSIEANTPDWQRKKVYHINRLKMLYYKSNQSTKIKLKQQRLTNSRIHKKSEKKWKS